MATVNEQIVTGRKFRKLIDETNKLWQKISFWTKASDVEFDNGMTAEIKLGAIDGITDSLASTSSRIAASAKSVATLNNHLAQQPNFIYDSTGKIIGYKTPGGADTVFPFNKGLNYDQQASSYTDRYYENRAGSDNGYDGNGNGGGWADISNNNIPHTFDIVVPLIRDNKLLYGIDNQIYYLGSSWIDHWAWSDYHLQILGLNDIVYYDYHYNPSTENERYSSFNNNKYCDLLENLFEPREDNSIIYRIIITAHNGSSSVKGSASTHVRITPTFKYK